VDAVSAAGAIRAVALGATVAALAACSHQERMKSIVNAYEGGNYMVAAADLPPLLEDRRDSEKDRTLYELEAGAVYAAAGDTAQSMAAFAAADERMWEYLDDAPEVRISEQAAAVLTNQTIITYIGRPYDRIMCTTYQALNHLAEGNLDAAGVSLRRAYEWQRDAAEKFKALQFQLTGRAEALGQATVAFRRAAGMLSESDRAYAEEDARLAEAAANGSALPPTVYVIVETGMGPWLEEFRLDIPLFTRGLPYVGAAFPVLRFKDGAVTGFTARAGGAAYPSSLLTDMDRVVGDDFNRRLPAIITMTIVSSATKAIATYLAQRAVAEQNPDAAWIVAIVGALYQVATNSADLRIWLTLPKQVLYARFPAPADGAVEIELGDGQRIGPISTESNGATIVHVRTPRMGVQPVVRTMRFPVK